MIAIFVYIIFRIVYKKYSIMMINYIVDRLVKLFATDETCSYKYIAT